MGRAHLACGNGPALARCRDGGWHEASATDRGNPAAPGRDYTGGRGSARPMDGDEQDAVLVRAARGSNRAAFAALLVRHQPLLFAMCHRALGDDDRAEDAVQEAVLQALLSLDRLRQ